MKHFLLLLIFIVLGPFTSLRADHCPLDQQRPNFILTEDPIQVFPNPATNYFGITETKGVQKIYVFNLVGKRLKQFFDIARDKHYFIGDLPRGMYLVQMVDANNQVIVTRRVSKR